MESNQKPRLTVQDGQITTTSLAVAEHFGKRHKDVLRAIERLLAEVSEDFNGRNFALVEYADVKGELRPMYRLSRDGFALVAMGFTGKEATRWKEAYINAFNLMEQTLRNRVAAPMAYTRTGKAVDPVEWAPFGLGLFHRRYLAPTSAGVHP